jgi:hypothetical protein
MKRILAIAAGAAMLVVPAPTSAAAGSGLEPLVGSLHEHSAYSDGWPGTRPRDYFDFGARYGNDFMGGSDHSDNLALPVVLSEACYGQGRGGDEVLLAQCALADQVNPADSFRKWDATAEQARQAMAAKPGFSAFRGFEWSSDRYGHISVYTSANFTSAYIDGGFADLRTFWRWFTTAPALGGGSDGIATFNHPGAKKLDVDGVDPQALGFNWNDFAYVPAADERMVGVEVFNDAQEYGSAGGPYPAGSYVYALDKGWHVGAVGAEDLGHRKPPLDNWGGPQWAKTVVLSAGRSPDALRAALLDRRFYAIGPGEGKLRLSFGVGGERIGARIERPAGEPMVIRARVNDPGVSLEVVTSAGKVVAAGRGQLRERRAAAAGEKYYFVRARRGTKIVAYSSPIWVSALQGGNEGSWLAGDLHVHTCYSHDAYCGPGDDSGPEEIYSTGGTVAERFAEAAVKGLDYLAITDHDDIRSWKDPDFGSAGVMPIQAYEMSVAGHAQVLGAKRQYDKRDVPALATALRADGGVFQANHPADGLDEPFTSCDQAVDRPGSPTPLHWKYGFDLRPDTIEVWNATTLMTPSERFWECWLDRGAHIAATGGSDSHGASTPILGMPTTWVFARRRDRASLLQAIREGRTTLSRFPPALGGFRLVLEGDADGDGKYESMIGDTVAPRAKLRVRAEGLGAPGTLSVRANGKDVALPSTSLAPGGTVEFRAPGEPGWVRAKLRSPTPGTAGDPTCAPAGQSISFCTDDLAQLALTSPIYVGR